jgi:hypothetical protein
VNERPEPGDVLCGPVSEARFLVVAPGNAAHMPSVDDLPLVRGRPMPCSTPAGLPGQYDLRGGQRYIDPLTGLTLLCVWPGRGSLCYEGRPLGSAA